MTSGDAQLKAQTLEERGCRNTTKTAKRHFCGTYGERAGRSAPGDIASSDLLDSVLPPTMRLF